MFSEKIARELETLRKKKNHLDDLVTGEKISKSTYEYLTKNLEGEIVEKEGQQKTFADTITTKLQELEENIGELELYLAEIELKYIASEIDADLYEKESKVLNLRIENARQELKNSRKVLFKIFPDLTPETPGIDEDVTEVEEEEKIEEVAEEAPSEIEEVEPVEETTPIETVEASEEDSIEAEEATEEPTIEAEEATEESPVETETWSENKSSYDTRNTRWWKE